MQQRLSAAASIITISAAPACSSSAMRFCRRAPRHSGNKNPAGKGGAFGSRRFRFCNGRPLRLVRLRGFGPLVDDRLRDTRQRLVCRLFLVERFLQQ